MIKKVYTKNAPEALGPYTQAIVSNGLVYTSGQIAINPASNMVEAATIQEQTEQVMKNLGEVLKEAGSDFECAIKTTCFLADMNDFAAFNEIYGRYPKYPIADAGYGSYNNYLYCEQHGMEKFMKFTMFEKETKNEKYKNDPYRAVNFKRDEKGNIICPNERKFKFKETRHIRGNQYGRTEEIYECEDCSNCCYKQECCPKAQNNRSIRLNQELTKIHKEVLNNLNSIHGALLCMNRSIQAEGTFGIIKCDKSYKRLRRKGLENVQLEFLLVACGYNLYKYHNKITRLQKCA